MQEQIRVAIRNKTFFTRSVHYIGGKLLYALPASWRRRLYRGEEHYCPLCDTHLSRILALHRPFHRYCPVCKSLARHRFIWRFLQSEHSPLKANPKSMLHIAPEASLEAKFRAIPGLHYLSGDLYMPNAMEKMDICNIHHPDGSFDFIFCSHVLEHVPSDRQALREFYRVLTEKGAMMILVPIIAEHNFEDPKITDPAEREKLFGQYDHLRAYGPDFADIPREIGFKVQEFKVGDLCDAEDIRRMDLDIEDRIFLCTRGTEI